MKTYFSKFLMLLNSVAVFLIFGCQPQNTDPLQTAKDKLKKNTWISYKEVAYYPHPDLDEVDTFTFEIEILKGLDDSLGYNYINKTGNRDYVFQDNRLKIVNHEDKLTRIYLPEQFKEKKDFKKLAEQNLRLKYSPQTLVQKEWTYKADTSIGKTIFHHYSMLDREGIDEGQKYRVEHHIFINSKTVLLERFERRFYIDGNLNQCVVNSFFNFKLSQNPVSLAYDFPAYTSVYGPEKKQESLKVGEEAPLISTVDMKGNAIDLKDFRGEKVLLNFSVIGCGGCKMALDHINKEDFRFTDKVKVLYINPEDDETRMKKYMEKVPINFQVIANASDIGKKYRVNAFPSFFLIDEEGTIAQIKIGYSKEFIDEFRE